MGNGGVQALKFSLVNNFERHLKKGFGVDLQGKPVGQHSESQ